MISYAEKFTSDQNEKAVGVKETLLSKFCNGLIGNAALSDDLKMRLTNLGRKESESKKETQSNNNFEFNKSVSTLVAHAENVIIKQNNNE